MARSNAIYQKLVDEVSRNATATTPIGAPSTDEDYLIANLWDENPAKPFKFDTTQGTIVLDFGAKQIVEVVSLIHTTLDAGTCYIEGNSSADFDAGVEFKAAYITPAWKATATRAWPVNGWLDLTAATPVSGSYDPTGFRYWRWNFSNVNSQAIWIGQMWMGASIRRFVPNLSWGLREKPRKPNIVNETAYGVENKLTRGTTIWQQEADLTATTALATALRDQWYDVDGEVRPWLLVPDGTLNEARLVRWNTDLEQDIERVFTGSNQMRLKFKEAARGLRPGV